MFSARTTNPSSHRTTASQSETLNTNKMLENIESPLPVGNQQLHVGRQPKEATEYDGARRRPCCFRQLYDRFIPRKAAGKTGPFHKPNDLAKLATEHNLSTQEVHNATQKGEQARNQSRASSLQLEDVTRENNELNIKCEKLQHDISICFHQKKKSEAAVKNAFKDLDNRNNLLQTRNDDLRMLEHSYNTVVMDKELQDQKFQELFENFETQERENLTLGDELRELESQTRSESAFVILRQKLETSQEETKHYKQQSRTFRKIIQESNVPMEINELDVSQKFKWLREEVHRIICSFYSMEKAYPVPGDSTLQNAETHLYNLFSPSLDRFEREIGVRAFVFGQLDEFLLFKELFGLEDMDESLGIEQGLGNFEAIFKQNHPDRHAELAAWRTATMECAKFLKPVSPSHPPDLCKHVAEELMRLLNPLGKYLQERTDQLMARWQGLCMVALKLTMKLRNYKDVYRCEMPALGDIVKDGEMDVEYEVHKENCKKHAELNGWPIAYVLSGALVRYSAEEPEIKVSLVKPWGVVHAHPDK
ncbi:uncharacterized protein Bfra_009081 [Botrytis fragariae]|uniref:Uncharacterized protein n=1 Tax=Botrytis fragariae TaxID=1964551 RepID=A0A8H6EH30_9HELO|nr:uncharacterized protein Bfra_009081 [Botrytis fragariae]KAF5872054.1 hypothetical protein Bfra_009081 [Botrytis fragariae]